MYPKLIQIGDFYLPTYGLMVAIGVLVGNWVAGRLGRRAGMDPEKLSNLVMLLVAAGLVGAKVAMILFDLPQYLADPGQLFTVETLQAAGVYQGGLLLAIPVAWWYVRKQGYSFLRVGDALAPGLAIGHAFGRIGCFMAGCCWGIACDRPWAVTFTNPVAREFTGVPLFEPLHPTQIYEAVGEAFLFVLLYQLALRRLPAGSILAAYLVLYSVLRYIVEFWRSHAQSLVQGLSLTQWISLAVLLFGLVLAWNAWRNRLEPAVSPASPKG